MKSNADRTIAMRRLSLITLMILQSVTLLSDSGNASDAGEQSKAQRTSRSARNRPQKVRELIKAAANGDTRKVLEILDKGLNVNASFGRDDSELSGMTALMVASSRGYPQMVEKLIKRGANVNLNRYTGETPLMFAAGNGNAKTVKALLRAGGNPNGKVMSPHAGEITPLSIAINADNQHQLEIVKILIGAKAEINPKGNFFVSPLMHAVSDLEMVKLLIAHGAAVNKKNFRGATALMGAAGGGTASVVRYLLEKGADVSARDKEGNTALMYAENRRQMLDASQREEIIQVLSRKPGESKSR